MTVTYTPGKCIDCEKKVPVDEMFCASHDPFKTNTQTPLTAGHLHNYEYDGHDNSIRNLAKSDSIAHLGKHSKGYIRSCDLFEVEGLLFIWSTSTFTLEKDDLHCVTVQIGKLGILEALFSEVEREAVYQGYPPGSEDVPWMIVHLTRSL